MRREERDHARRLVEAFRRREPGRVLISAHRGLRESEHSTENSISALVAAAEAGLLSVEIDLRLTSDGELVCIHDTGLGRATNIAEHMGMKDVYSPITGLGYNPAVSSLPWKGLMEKLRLKNGLGQVTDEKIARLDDLLSCVRDEHLQILIFMDVKEYDAIEAAYSVVSRHSDAWAVSAMEWCIWKPDVAFVRYPDELEQQSWFQDACAKYRPPLWIPVLEPCRPHFDTLRAVQEWSSREYVVSIEVGLRSPKGPLREVVEWMSAQRPLLGMGFFGALGEGPRRIDAGGRRWCYYEGRPVSKHDDILLPGETPDALDHRADLDAFIALGYSWIIADLLPESTSLYANQQHIKAQLA